MQEVLFQRIKNFYMFYLYLNSMNNLLFDKYKIWIIKTVR